jgi:hypothetical protein
MGLDNELAVVATPPLISHSVDLANIAVKHDSKTHHLPCVTGTITANARTSSTLTSFASAVGKSPRKNTAKFFQVSTESPFSEVFSDVFFWPPCPTTDPLSLSRSHALQ